MNYFRPYPLPNEEAIFAAWDSQVAEAKETPWLAEALAQAGGELFPRFAACYAELRALPRGARRALQHRLARSGALSLPEWLQGSARHALQHKLARSLAGAALLLALGQGVALANTITVTTNKPAINDGDGQCSLIEAILNANNDDQSGSGDCDAGSGDDTIVLPKKTFTLTYAYDNTYGDTGLPLIDSTITIEGNGAKIVRKKSADPFRLIAVADGASLFLYNSTLSGGYAASPGGAIVNYGHLYIHDSTITGNTATGNGGGIFNYEAGLRVYDSTISKNKAGNNGGGISNYHAGARIYDSIITGNTAGSDGGGINNFEAGLRVYDSTVSKNTAGDDGGGIYNGYGYTLVNDSIVSGNKAGNVGGGIANRYGEVNIDPTTISKNTAYLGGGIFNYAYNYGDSLVIFNSNITQNVATGFAGGGVYIDRGDWYLGGTNITKNKATDIGGGVFNDGDYSDEGGNNISLNKQKHGGDFYQD
jgi:hypothetical protein